MSPAVLAALIGLGSVLGLQLLGLIIWGSQLEMRMRACEASCREMREVRDIVLSLKDQFGFFREDLQELNTALKWMKPATYEVEPLGRAPRRPPLD